MSEITYKTPLTVELYSRPASHNGLEPSEILYSLTDADGKLIGGCSARRNHHIPHEG